MRTKLCPGTYIKPDGGGGSQQKGSRPHPPHREAGSREANGVLACLRELWPGQMKKKSLRHVRKGTSFP